LRAAPPEGINPRMSDVFDLPAYFRRIGYAGQPKADLATLAALNALHVSAIPFENLDPLTGRTPALDLPSLQVKLIGQRRGGYCFEQNAVFRAALEAIGFAVTPLSARVRWVSGMDAPMTPATHMLLKVDLAEGPFIVDVGFGIHLQDAPLRLEIGPEQMTPAGHYRLRMIDGFHGLEMKQAEGWRTGFLFTLNTAYPNDYVMANWYTSTSPWSRFPKMLSVERVTNGVRFNLVNRRLTERARGVADVDWTISSASELGEILDRTFNLAPPVPVEDIWARVPVE
jgi:N-hydroxyarylamine O-acetyltransferase